MGEDQNIKIAWQLVAQFVSWEFCRYMFDQTEKENDEMKSDVLIYLRNMIVERTEKQASEVTKHEIVAKFIMELRTIKKTEKLPYIQELAKTVVKICSDLKGEVEKLLPRLEGLLSILELNEGTENRSNILYAIVEAVHDFTKEACKVLPLPDLPQMLEPWLYSESQDLSKKKNNKVRVNMDVYKKAVGCLKKEVIPPWEAEIIAKSLYKDPEWAKLEKLFLNFSDTETDLDSQQQSPAKQPNKFHSLLCNPLLHTKAGPSSTKTTSDDSKCTEMFDTSAKGKELPLCRSFGFNVDFESEREPVTDSDSPPIMTATQRRNLKKHKNIPVPSPVKPSSEVVNISSDSPPVIHLEADSSPFLTVEENRESEKRTCNSVEKSSAKLNNPRVLNSSNEDIFDSTGSEDEYVPPVKSTSFTKNDCAPSSTLESIRKKNREKYLEFIQDAKDLSEVETFTQSSVSSCIDMSLNQLLAPSPRIDNYDNDGDSSDCDKHGEIKFLTPTIYKKDIDLCISPPRNVWESENNSESPFNQTSQSTSHNDDPSFRPSVVSPPRKPARKQAKKSPKKRTQPKRSKKKQLQSDKEPKIPRQMTLRGFGFASNENKEKQKGTARKTFKLFDNDLIAKNFDESSLFEKKEKKNKIKLESLGNKKQCPECLQKFKTNILLKKHVFLEHSSDVL